MAENIEIKARARGFDDQAALAAALADGPATVLHQTDVFFKVAEGRLKLRYLSETLGHLIAYTRPDVPGPKSSHYEITVTAEPARLEQVLRACLPVIGTVQKKRTLYLTGHTRIHLDEVEGLGRFIELEVVLQAGQSAEMGRRIAADLMKALEIEPSDLLAGAYFDLLQERS